MGGPGPLQSQPLAQRHPLSSEFVGTLCCAALSFALLCSWEQPKWHGLMPSRTGHLAAWRSSFDLVGWQNLYAVAQEMEHVLQKLEQLLLTAPWALTDNYVTAIKEGKALLQIVGLVGDPTGQGRGFSYLREVRRVGQAARP